ncbi:MAG: flagellar basal body P-ring protein FlgI [Anaerohalosphaeraceae bacterium]
MKRRHFFLFTMALSAAFLSSCSKKNTMDITAEPKINLDTTIGQLADFSLSPSVPVRGYGMVAGLWGSGSSECPPQLRPQLEKYIWQQMPKASTSEVKNFIESTDTAAVEIIGEIPPLSMTGDRFDIQIRPLAKTQTTSLRGGHLFKSELKEMSRMLTFDQFAKNIGMAEGQIFTKNDAETKQESYYIFGGGVTALKSSIVLTLKEGNFRAASIIRNRINERFGANIANATSQYDIQIVIAPQYRHRRQQFLSMLKLLYLSEDEILRNKRIDLLCTELADPQKADDSELALEAIGRPCLSRLVQMLDTQKDPALRLRIARCMLNIGDIRGISCLREIAMDSQSSLRITAMESLASAKLKDIESFLSQLLSEDSIEIRLAAYQQLLNHNSMFVKRISVGTDFFIDLVNAPGSKIIYACQKEFAGMILLGSPIVCQHDLFVDMGSVMLNARPDDKYVSLVRRHPARPKLIGPIKSSFNVEDIIRTLGHAPDVESKTYPWPGLGINYSEILDIIEQMCRDNLIHAEFMIGPLTQAGSFLEKTEQKTDNTPAQPDKTINN